MTSMTVMTVLLSVKKYQLVTFPVFTFRIHGNHRKRPHNTFSLDIYQYATTFLQVGVGAYKLIYYDCTTSTKNYINAEPLEEGNISAKH